MKSALIAPSLLSADFSCLNTEIQSVASADWLHLDIMDGHFVPNLTFGPVLVEGIRKETSLPLDCHLMVTSPEKWILPFQKAGANSITIHIESQTDTLATLQKIRSLNLGVGISLNPNTPVEQLEPYLPHVDLVLVMSVFPGFGGQKFMPEVLSKVEALNRHSLRSKFKIEIDGGVSASTIQAASRAGCDVFVAGNAVFKEKNRKNAIADLKLKAQS